MSKNRRRNKRKESKRKIKPAKTRQAQQYESDEGEFQSKKEKKQNFNKRYLILCEGETEKAYFSGLKNNILLKEKFRAVQIEIIAPSNKKNVNPKKTLLDNSLKGMVWEAMQRKRKADKQRNSYDEIWLVIDNDERNSYIISKKTIFQTKKLLSKLQSDQFATYLNAFFLSNRHYIEFLQTEIGLTKKLTEEILLSTDKNHLFEEYEHVNPKKQFYTNSKFTYGQHRTKNIPKEKDFDSSWKNWLQKAYSCRTFENWLILHFEACKISFTTSQETNITVGDPSNPKNSIHHLWTFVPNYCKGFDKPRSGKISAYNILKPQPFNKYETEVEAQAVIDKVNTAILHSFWLRKEMKPKLTLQGGRYYEINPYTDINYLLSTLLEKEVIYGSLGHSIEFAELTITILNSFANEFQVTLINHSSNKRVLINNSNKEVFFKILTITADHLHYYSTPNTISHTINIPPDDLTPSKFTINFPKKSIDKSSYLIFQYNNQQFLYFPI